MAVPAIVALALAVVPATARADGDPASDVLISQTAFIPWDAGVSATETAELRSLLSTAARHGYPVRVALITSASDLGSVTALWRQPQNYAHFLSLELSLSFRGTVLVVMPNGAGVYRPGISAAVARATLARARARAGRGDVARVASAIVHDLAAADGHALPSPSTEVTSPAASPGSNGITAWLAFGAGAVLIVLAWTASLRARPVRLRRRDASPRGGR